MSFVQNTIRKIGMLVTFGTLINVIFVSKTIASGLLEFVNYSTGMMYLDCYQPIDIYISTSGEETLSVDTKIYLNSNFQLNPDSSNYTTYISGEMDNMMNFMTGTSTTGSKMGDEYFYINTTQDNTNPISGEDIKIITLFLSPVGLNEGQFGNLNFYYKTGWNGDDSNISSGNLNNTQFEDILFQTIDGSYTITGASHCPRRPYITTSSYRQHTRITNTTGAERVWTSVVAGPEYTNILDTERNNWTNSTGRTIWTRDTGHIVDSNTGLLLTLNTNTGIKLISVQMLDLPNIEPVGGIAGAINGRELTRELYITGNILTGFLTFENIYGNYGNTFSSGTSNYDYGFNIDVFRIDTKITLVGTSTYASGAGYEDVLLSGYYSSGSSNADSGWHSNRSIRDDEFTITKFSGINETLYGYNSATGYNTTLINQYGGQAGSGFTMQKTIRFIQSRSGLIYYIDRAGNTGSVFVSVDVDPSVLFKIYATPAFRQFAGELGEWSGDATEAKLRIAYKTGNGQNRIFNPGSTSTGQYTIDLNRQGSGEIYIIPPGSGYEYLAVIKGSGMLSVGFTGIRTNNIFDTGTNLLNFESGSLNHGNTSNFFPNYSYNNLTYLIGGDIIQNNIDNFDIINTQDLTEINSSLISPVTITKLYYDVDLNDVINSIEQAVSIEYDNAIGFIENFGTGSNQIEKLYKTGFQLF